MPEETEQPEELQLNLTEKDIHQILENKSTEQEVQLDFSKLPYNVKAYLLKAYVSTSKTTTQEEEEPVIGPEDADAHGVGDCTPGSRHKVFSEEAMDRDSKRSRLSYIS